MRVREVLTAAVLSLVALVPPAIGQDSVYRKRFWFGGEVGYGWGTRCASCPTTGEAGVTGGSMRAGWSVGRQVRLGVEAFGWNRVGSDESGRALLAEAAWYPWRARGVFARVGVGSATLTLDSNPDGPDDAGSGPAYLVGVGWDLRATRSVSITPSATLLYARPGQTTLGLLPSRTGVATTVISLGIGLTFR